jgi:hypothetical protein
LRAQDGATEVPDKVRKPEVVAIVSSDLALCAPVLGDCVGGAGRHLQSPQNRVHVIGALPNRGCIAVRSSADLE